MIITQNETKDVLNEVAARAFANRTGRPLHWYYSVDQHDGKVLKDRNLVNHLRRMNSGVTNQRLGKLPLVIGMPVMVTSNFDVENGIVNGCTGILESVRYWVDDNDERHAISCVISSDSITGEPLPTLSNHQAVAIADDTHIQFMHPASKKRCIIHRIQLPILPAFAMTVHKSQGLTLDKVFADLESCRGSESPYVMISRVKSLDGLLIIRPFNKQRITCRLNEELRREFARLRILELLTIIEHGSDRDARISRKELTIKGLQDLIGREYTDFSAENVNVEMLRSQEIEIDKLTRLIEHDSDIANSHHPRKRLLQNDIVASGSCSRTKRRRVEGAH